ncbi:MAG: polyisoprenoid-binding protein YceI [Sediminicola sp.]
MKKFPVATFVQTEAVTLENGYAIISGNMTIRGEIKIENIKIQIKPNKDGITISLEHKIDRTLYGVNHNSPSIFKKIKENAIADEFILKCSIKFQK